MRLAPIALLVTVLATACGSGARQARLDGCTLGGAKVVHFPQPDSPRLRGAIFGHGPRGVVFANGSGQSLCDWLPFAHRVARAGFRAIVFDYGAGTPDDGAAAAARELHRQGARTIAFVGTSYGGKGAIVGAWRTPQASAVVGLSAVTYDTEVVAASRALRIPVLLVAARDDPYAAADESRLIYRTLATRARKLVIVPGDQHAQSLLPRHHVGDLIVRWLREHAQSP